MRCINIIVLITILLSCNSDSGTNTLNSETNLVNLIPRLNEINSTDSNIITGHVITLNTSAIDADNDELTFVWSSEGGQFTDQNDSFVQTSVNWTSPQEKGIYTISCTVSDGELSDTGVFIVYVASIPSLVFVESGDFDMGDNFEEGQRNERPVHTVFLDAYHIGKYEVTNEQFVGFLNDTINAVEFEVTWYDISDPDAKISFVNNMFTSDLGFEDHPVAFVNWYGARAYCNWLSKQTGDTYRLPTEAEWEKAARGNNQLNQVLGHQRRYPWGDTFEGSLASYGNGGNLIDSDAIFSAELSPVGYYDGTVRDGFRTSDNSSPYGVYDMSSNVREWCLDRSISTYYRISPTSNPMGVQYGTSNVIRGASWEGNSIDIRAATRTFSRKEVRSTTVGFRVIRTN